MRIGIGKSECPRGKLQERAGILGVKCVGADRGLRRLSGERERQPIAGQRRGDLGHAHEHPAVVEQPPVVEAARQEFAVRRPAGKLRLFQERCKRRLAKEIEPRRIGSAARVVRRVERLRSERAVLTASSSHP